mmetsp:Transcript_11394/g.19221  ORF Transcript_11394/g.19221 Transcript_11394/m.19221 type:complete len:106 (+) Transcript_11394:1-318(+)
MSSTASLEQPYSKDYLRTQGEVAQEAEEEDLPNFYNRVWKAVSYEYYTDLTPSQLPQSHSQASLKEQVFNPPYNKDKVLGNSLSGGLVAKKLRSQREASPFEVMP